MKPSAPLIIAAREYLLELVDHQQQPFPASAPQVAPGPTAGPPRRQGLPGGRSAQTHPGRRHSMPDLAASAPASGATRTASSSSGARPGTNTHARP